MTAKVRIKAGSVEFEYEGETELAIADIKDLFSHIEMLFKVPNIAEGTGSQPSVTQPVTIEQSKESSAGSGQMLHVNSIATKLKAKSGSEVALAAAAALQIFEKKDTFTRAELLEMMKKATMYYKNNMSGNLTSILRKLVGSKFNQISDGVYSLAADPYKELESALA